MGKEKGLKEAFISFADPDAILLRDGSEPIRGIEAIAKSFGPQIPGFVLNWEPEFARVADSGELGYTLGHFQALDAEGKVLNKGTYTSVWKKNAAGAWRWLIDVGISY
jgi:ketosteroid isomerase-like protein